MTVSYGRELLDLIVAGTPSGETPVRHICDIPARNAEVTSWPQWAHSDAIAAFAAQGVTAPWSHQVAAATLAFTGRHVVVATGTASGKSVAYQLPILTALASEPRARALYLAPTKALGHDQLRAVRELITGLTISSECSRARTTAIAPTSCGGSPGKAPAGFSPIPT